MRLPVVKVPYKAGDVYTLYAWGDFHFFNASCDKDAIFDTRQKIIDDPRALHLFMGDAAEFITEKDPRWDAGAVDTSLVGSADHSKIADVSVDYLSKFFAPIADKCIGWHDGNHEKAINKHNSTDVGHRICEGAGINLYYHTPGMSITLLQFDDGCKHTCSININSAHGRQAGRMDGAKINNMKHALAYFHCDIMVRGHSHSFFASPSEWLEPNSTHTKIVAKRGYVSHTGSYLRTYQQEQDSYAEDGDFPPTSIGCPRFLLYPSREGCRIEVVS